MSDFLNTIAKASEERAKALAKAPKSVELDKPAFPLKLGAFDLIAELKNRSPSEGALADDSMSRGERTASYVRGGAAAISVLTEPTQFDGELEHLEEAVEAAGPVPVMRKDFLVDPRQVLEAKAAGASGVLLIVTMSNDRTLEGLLACAYEHALFALLECFDEEDLGRARALVATSRHGEQAERGKLLLGVNTRDLRTLHVDPDRLRALAPLLPEGVACVAESGLHEGGDAADVAGWGYRLALVGTALMRAGDPERLIREMCAAGRARKAA